MLFLGMSVTSFAQNFSGLDSVHYDNGDDVYSTIVKKRIDAIHRMYKVLDANDVDTNYTEIEKNSDVLIFSYLVDTKDRNKLYVFCLVKIASDAYKISVIHQDNRYTEYFYSNNKLLVYDPN
jgi:hypothetical protein